MTSQILFSGVLHCRRAGCVRPDGRYRCVVKPPKKSKKKKKQAKKQAIINAFIATVEFVGTKS